MNDDRTARHVRVLVTDGNPDCQAIAVHLLERRGCDATAAASGVEALQLLERQHYDVVLLELQMPQLDGFGTASAIRERERTTGTRTPIIATPAQHSRRDADRCRTIGIDAYVPKPIDWSTLFGVIDELSAAALLPRRADA